MKGLILGIILLFSVSAYSQDISLPRDVAERALTALELVPQLEVKINALEIQVIELKAQQKTPCSIAIETVKLNLISLENIDTSKLNTEDAKQVRKTRDKTYSFMRKKSSNILQSQCGYKEENQLADIIKQIVPLSFLFFK